jgi:protein-disulfide isomerase
MAKQATSSLAARAEQRREQQRQQQQQLSLIGVVVAIVVVIFAVLIFFLTRPQANSPVGKYTQLVQTVTSDGIPILGDPTAHVVVAEFADFSCPHCLEYHPTITNLIDHMVRTGQIRLMFVPQTFVGRGYSEIAAKFALCVQKSYTPRQAGFWDMQDILFDIQSHSGALGFTIKNIIDSAASAGITVNSTDVTQCVSGGEMDGVLQASSAMFQKNGGRGTPTMMYSTDGGETFQFFTDDGGKQIIDGGPTYDIVISRLNSLGVG